MLYNIDTGISFKINDYNKLKLLNKIAFDIKKDKIKFIKKDRNIKHFHGEIIFYILINNLNYDTEAINIRILDKNLNSTYLQLKSALNFILDRNIPAIINLSLGLMIDDYIDDFKDIIQRLLQKQIFIISSASKVPSYPSVLEDVISVSDLNMYQNDRAEIKHKIDFIVDIGKFNYDFIPYSSTSFAAPFVTAQAANIMNEKNISNINELREELTKYFERWE